MGIRQGILNVLTELSLCKVPQPSSDVVLEINYLGYEPIAQTVGSRTNITFTLRESAVDVDAVVVTALGINRSE